MKGQPSKMVVKKKNPSGTGSRCENASIKQRSKPATLSKRQDTSNGQGFIETGTSSRSGHSPVSQGLKTYSNDPSQVRQWAASAAGFSAFEDHTGQQQYTTATGHDILAAQTESHMPGSFPMSRSPVSHYSVPQAAQAFDSGSRTGYNDMCVPNAANAIHGLPLGLNTQQPCLNGEVNLTGVSYSEDVWSYPTPVAEDMMYSNSAAMPTTFMDTWPQMSCQPGQELAATGFPCTSNPMSWSPLSAVDASASSSYSQSSYVGPQPDTPLSQAFPEGTWSADQQGNLDPEHGTFQGFSLGDSLQLASPAEFLAQQDDGLSTIKAGRPLQRMSLSNIWTQGEEMTQPYMDCAFPGTNYPRRSSESEPTTAREHQYYQAGPRADGMYHCPFADLEDCTHKPEKLKCNYDKHLDSHLKPYRCKISTCAELQFSSTACLLRHEREAHGMHGHGEKPHLCSFQDCDRSVPGNGFPRRWNLFDHMKRVHDYSGPASSSSSNSPTPSSPSSYRGTATLALGKRRPSSPMQVDPPKRPKSTTATKPTNGGKVTIKANKAPVASTSQGKRQSMQKMWYEQKAAIKARLDSLDPNDAPASEQINADYAILQTIGMNIRLQEAGQLAVV